MHKLYRIPHNVYTVEFIEVFMIRNDIYMGFEINQLFKLNLHMSLNESVRKVCYLFNQNFNNENRIV